jgi:hypothetical protein
MAPPVRGSSASSLKSGFWFILIALVLFYLRNKSDGVEQLASDDDSNISSVQEEVKLRSLIYPNVASLGEVSESIGKRDQVNLALINSKSLSQSSFQAR